MSKKTKKILQVLLFIWLVFSLTDFTLAQANRSPLFSVPLVRYKDGGSAEYYGLGYKVIRYVELSVERGPEVVKVDFGSWLMEFSHPNRE
jgi:hypothetical protein